MLEVLGPVTVAINHAQLIPASASTVKEHTAQLSMPVMSFYTTKQLNLADSSTTSTNKKHNISIATRTSASSGTGSGTSQKHRVILPTRYKL